MNKNQQDFLMLFEKRQF